MRNYLMLLIFVVSSCQDGMNNRVVEKSYYDDGTLKLIIEYDKASTDLVCGVRFYPNGKTHKKYCLLNDSLEGEYKEYFENGEIMKSILYSNGEIEGEVVFYHLNGNIKEKGRYKNNKKEGIISIYRQNGSLKAKDYAVDDFVHHVALYDTNGVATGVENYIPRISIINDGVIYSGDTLSVKVEIPLPEEEFKMDSIYVNLDIIAKELRDSLHFPKNMYLLKKRITTKRFLFDDVGEFIVYGLLSEGKGFDAHRYEKFEVPFTVLAK